MSEGKLHEHIGRLMDKISEDYYKAYRKPANLDSDAKAFKKVIDDVLAEAKQDFPKLTPIHIDPNWSIEDKLKTAQYQSERNVTVFINKVKLWFERWFGKAGADVGKAQTKKD